MVLFNCYWNNLWTPIGPFGALMPYLAPLGPPKVPFGPLLVPNGPLLDTIFQYGPLWTQLELFGTPMSNHGPQ